MYLFFILETLQIQIPTARASIVTIPNASEMPIQTCNADFFVVEESVRHTTPASVSQLKSMLLLRGHSKIVFSFPVHEILFSLLGGEVTEVKYVLLTAVPSEKYIDWCGSHHGTNTHQC